MGLNGELLKEGYMVESKEIIELTGIEGISRLSGTDIEGNKWVQFEVDYLADQIDGECCICGAELTEGWMCLDGGDEVCSDHIIYSIE